MSKRCSDCKFSVDEINCSCDELCVNFDMYQPSITANEYQQLALRTEPEEIKNSGVVNRLTQGCLGLTGEAGECADLLKKHIYQGHELDREHFAKELGDVAWYLAVSADAIGCTLEYIFETNINKLKERYPDGFDADKSLHRAEGDV